MLALGKLGRLPFCSWTGAVVADKARSRSPVASKAMRQKRAVLARHRFTSL